MKKVFTLFLCNCKMNKLEKSSIDCHINTYIDDEKNIFAAFFKICQYNVSSGFERNYF